MNLKRYAMGLMAGVSALGCCTGAFAQAAGSGVASQADPVTEGVRDSDIIITGTRVSNGNASPSPVTVVQTSDLLSVQPGSNLADALNVLPVFAGSRGAGSNPTTSGSASGGNGSANQLNLRNLGIVRTLVLVDGVRIPPTLYNGSVDVDLIPQMLVERVDVVTGGVSAVYGSDAVAGVVNYILDKDYEGLKVEASTGISNYGDAGKLEAGVAFGTRIGESTHFEASYQYHDSKGIDRRSDRPWMDNVGVGGLGTTAAPYELFSGLRQASFPAGGRIIGCGGCSISGQYFATDGTLAPFVNGASTGTNNLQVGGSGGIWDSSLLQPLESHQVFARLSQKFGDKLNAYVQFSGNFKTNTNFQEFSRLTNARISSTNAFLPAAYQTALANAGQSTFTLSKTFEHYPRINQDAQSDQRMINAGVDGWLGDWRWGIDYVNGRSVLETSVLSNLNNQRLSAALDAVSVGGKIVCHASIANPAAYGDCVPLNPFGPTAASQQAFDYVTGATNYRSVTRMNDISAEITGSPFDIWAGPVNVALSAEWRKVSFEAESSATSDDLVNCTGLRYNCTATQSEWFITLATQPEVSQTVWEVAGEIDVPIFVDSALGRSFNVNGAARYTKYDTSGEYWTWKAGIDWQITDALRVRGTRSRDIRAPTLYDLFAERFIVNVVGTDLLTNQSPSIPSVNGGNPNLTAEIADTITAGIVWRPTADFSIALDGYSITVNDAILSVNGGEGGFQRACYASGGTSPYCALHERPGSVTDTSAANAWTRVYNQLFNISSIKTKGLDLEMNYRTNLFARPLTFRLLGSYQPTLEFTQPNVASRNQAGSAFGPTGFAATPEWRAIGFVRYRPSDDLSIDLLQRWRSSMKLSGEENQVWVSNHMKSFATTSMTLTYTGKSKIGEMDVYLNVQNIFNTDPPVGAFYGNGTRAGLRDGYAVGDDPRGRYYSVGARMRF